MATFGSAVMTDCIVSMAFECLLSRLATHLRFLQIRSGFCAKTDRPIFGLVPMAADSCDIATENSHLSMRSKDLAESKCVRFAKTTRAPFGWAHSADCF